MKKKATRSAFHFALEDGQWVLSKQGQVRLTIRAFDLVTDLKQMAYTLRTQGLGSEQQEQERCLATIREHYQEEHE